MWLLAILQFIPQLVVLAEQGFGKGTGAAKKAAVIGAGAALVGQTIATVSPVVGQVIDATVSAFNTAGGVPTTTVAPPQAPLVAKPGPVVTAHAAPVSPAVHVGQ